jgi:excisionase family DNA binding protein
MEPTAQPALKIPEVAAELRLNNETIRRKLVAGEIAGFKVGNRWRVRRETLDAIKAESEARTAP